MKKNILYVIIVVLLMVIAVGGTYIFISNKNNNTNNENKINENVDNNNEESNNKEEITLSDEELEKYLSYVPYLSGSVLLDTQYIDAYNGTYNSIDIIDKSIILYMAYLNTKEYDFNDFEEVPKIDTLGEGFDGLTATSYFRKEDISNILLKMYNINISIVPEKISLPGGTLFLQDKYYMTVFGAGSSDYYKKLYSINYKIENGDLIMTEEALFIELDWDKWEKCNRLCNPYNVFKNTEDMHQNKNIIETINYEKTPYYNIQQEDIKNMNIYSNPTKYKHTFKKNDSGYYWFSTEAV